MWDESKHPRDKDGQFSNSNGVNFSELNEQIFFAKENGIDLPLKEDGTIDELKLQEKITEYIEESTLPEEISKIYGKEFRGYKGQSAVEKLLKEKQGHVKGAFHREDIGDIDIIWGNDNLGLQHIIKRREEQGTPIVDFLGKLAETIEKGKIRCKNSRGNFEILYDSKIIVVSPEYHNFKVTFVLTAYKTRYK